MTQPVARFSSGRAVVIEFSPDEQITIGEARHRIAKSIGTITELILLIPAARHEILPDDEPFCDDVTVIVLGIKAEAEKAVEDALMQHCCVTRMEDLPDRGVLRLKYWGFSNLPQSLGLLTTLRGLWLSENQLTSLPSSIGQLTALESLDVSKNQLASLPESIGQLTLLEDLSLGGNQLANLPPSIGKLTALKWLDLGGNQLTSLPSSIGQLTELKHLHLTGNRLTSLPSSIGQLTGLEQLWLRQNRLTSLPQSLTQLPKLKLLALDDMMKILHGLQRWSRPLLSVARQRHPRQQ